MFLGTFRYSTQTRLALQLFRVLLLRRLWLPLHLSSRTCRCGRPLDLRGHHCATCPRAAGSHWRALRPRSAEKHAPGRRRMFLCEMWTSLWLTTTLVGWRWSLIGFPCLKERRKAQVAIDTTLVSPVRAGGKPRRHCARQDGAAIAEVHKPNARLARSSLALRGARGWWYWQMRWVV